MSKLYLVFGGRVSDPRGLDFVDLKQIEVVGFYEDYASAVSAWRGAAQRTVDDGSRDRRMADNGHCSRRTRSDNGRR